MDRPSPSTCRPFLIKHFGFNTLNLHKLYAEIYSNDQKKKVYSSVMVSKKMEYCAIIIFSGFYIDSHILSV